MRYLLVGLICAGFFSTAIYANAQMSSTNFKIQWDSVGLGGSDTSSSSSYSLRDTVGSAAIGSGSSTSYELRAGYRQGVFDEFLEFNVEAISGTSSAASGLSGSVITVADASSFSENDLVFLVEDSGSTGIGATGKVSATTATTVTVDSLITIGGTPSIDGTDDTLYLLSGSTAALGTLATGTVTAAAVGWEVSIEGDNGYVVSVIEDGNMRSGANDINDVSDGTVTAGSEEYGARSSDTSLANSTFDTADAAITTSFQEVATESSAVFESVNALLLKAAIGGGTVDGSYSHTISFIASGNF